MSQLHHEGLRKQMIVDKRATAADFSWLKSSTSQDKRNSSSSSRIVHNTSQPASHSRSGNLAVRSSCTADPRRREVVITDPYLEAIVKESRARNRKRFTSTDYFMQWWDQAFLCKKPGRYRQAVMMLCVLPTEQVVKIFRIKKLYHWVRFDMHPVLNNNNLAFFYGNP